MYMLMQTYFSIHMRAPTHSQEQIEELTTMLEAEREKSGVPTGMCVYMWSIQLLCVH